MFNAVVLGVLFCPKGESVDTSLIVEPPCLSIPFSLGLHLRGPPSFKAGSDSSLSDLLIEGLCKSGLYLLDLPLDIFP